jgi:hypothetical protein
MYIRVVIALAAIGCNSTTRSTSPSPSPSPSPSITGCNDPVFVVSEDKTACEAPAGTTIVDLRDAWTPRLFAPGADGTAPDYRATYLALAAETSPDGKPLASTNKFTELYGVVPSLAIVRKRFTETARYACRAKIDSAPIATLAKPYGEEHAGQVKHWLYQRALHGATLEKARVQRGVADYSAFANDRELGFAYTQWKTGDDLYRGMTAAQRHLVCEGFLADKDASAEYSWAMGMAVDLFQRRNFLVPNGRLDPETRAALATDPHELDYRFALRILRERVVDATGLLEDGTAGAGPVPILGRMLDPEPMRGARGYRALPNAAPDLVGQATEAAARALGWTSPAAAQAWLAKHSDLRVAITLPAPPAYHSAHMDLFAEIDRGDVWYDDQPTPRISWKRPALVVYVRDGETKRPLIRWPTTIGGWSDVNIGGAIVKRWKESDVGPRVWRDVFAAPTWLPPPATPDAELVKWLGPGKWEAKRSIVGPGPMSAFGMMLLPHYKQIGNKFIDNGIGTHGSAVVTSILNGTSHGCHRLYNQLAVRLGSFLLRHRDHVVKGQKPEHYRRTIHVGGTHLMKIDTRGFVYELTPPVPVDVLAGNIRSDRKTPPAASVAAGAE